MMKKIIFDKSILILFLICIFLSYALDVLAGNEIWTTSGPYNGREMDLTIGKNSIYASGYNGIWKSENKGFSWIEKNNGIPIPYDVNNIETFFHNDNVVFAATWNQGIYKSVDGGNNWTKLNSFPGNYIRKLKIDFSNENILYVGTGLGSQPGTVYKTTDGGNVWQELNLGVKGIIAYITIAPTNNQLITTGIINTINPGRYKSENGGATWIRISNESNIDFPDYPTPNPQTYYKITGNKLYISLDHGNSWAPTDNNNLPANFQIRYLTIDHSNADIIYLYSIQSGVYESKNAGNTWQSINNGLFGHFDLSSFQDLYIDKNNPSTLFITTNGNGIWQYTLSETIISPTPTPTPTPLKPIILLPGLGGSWNHENMILGIEKPQSEWFMTPGIKIYDGLIETFKNAGYKTEAEDRNLFIFNYNWTKPVNLIAEDLKSYIENVIQSTGDTKIDLVGHSLGGLVARTYLQNNQNHSVDQLVTLGSPLKGIPSIYYLWEGGDLNKSFNSWQKIGLGLFLHLRKPGFRDTAEAVRSIAPILKDLLPTFSYLKQNSEEKSIEQMFEKNDWLIGFNGSLPESIPLISHNLIGILPNSTLRWIHVSSPSWLDKILGLWVDGKPVDNENNQGDQTVLSESAFINGANIINLENVEHQELVTSSISQEKIMEVLNLNPNSISNLSENFNYETALVFQIASPANIEIFDFQENSVGHGDNKLMIITNPNKEIYQAKLTGSENGQYSLHVGQITKDDNFWTTVSGSINKNDEISYFVNFDPSSPLKNPIVDQSGEVYLKTFWVQFSELRKDLGSKNFPPLVKKLIFLRFKHIEFLLNKNKFEGAIESLYQFKTLLSFWQKISNLEENEIIYFKNKTQEIIDNLEIIYFSFENNKGKNYPQKRLRTEIIMAEKIFETMEIKLKKFSKNSQVNSEAGHFYLLAQEKLNEAKNSTSFEAHIKIVGVQHLSKEFFFLFK